MLPLLACQILGPFLSVIRDILFCLHFPKFLMNNEHIGLLSQSCLPGLLHVPSFLGCTLSYLLHHHSKIIPGRTSFLECEPTLFKDYPCTQNITIPSFQNPTMCTHKITIPSFLPRPDGFLPATASILPVDDLIDLVMIMTIMLTKMMEGQHQNHQN